MDKSTARTLPRIGLVATDALRVLGLQAILADGGGFEVVLLAAAAALHADVEVMLIDESAIEHIFELLAGFRQSRPKLGVMVLGAQSDFEWIERVIGAGAKGYLNHAVNEAELRMAVGVVRDGSVWAPRKVLARLISSSLGELGGTQAASVSFTKREQEVLRLLVQGQPNRDIANALGVDEGTVKAHMGRLMRKAGVDNRTALTMRALERQWA